MGSQSDWQTMRHAAAILTSLAIAHEARIISAHRTPERLYRFCQECGTARIQGDHRRCRRRSASARHDGGADHPAGARGPDGNARPSAAMTASFPSSRCRRACRSARWRWARRARSTRRCWRRGSWRSAMRRSRNGSPTGSAQQTAAVAHAPDAMTPVTFAAAARPVIGILGGGQLGRMLALAAARLGLKCHIFAPEGDNPAFEVAIAAPSRPMTIDAALAKFARVGRGRRPTSSRTCRPKRR